MKKSVLFITCDEAKHICDRSQYGEASVWEKFKLNVRLSWCKVTRSYSNRNRKLTKVLNNNSQKLEPSAKENLKSAFEKELAKQQ